MRRYRVLENSAGWSVVAINHREIAWCQTESMAQRIAQLLTVDTSATRGRPAAPERWWICTDRLAHGGRKIMGPFDSCDLAFAVREAVEAAHPPTTYTVDLEVPT